MLTHAMKRTGAFCDMLGMKVPVLMAPMAGSCPPELAVSVMEAGGMGACGALLMDPEAIARWASDVRARSDGPFQMNLWIPDPAPARDAVHEAEIADFLAGWGPRPIDLAPPAPLSFADQCAALIDARPTAISSIMGLYPPDVVAEAKAEGIRWFATATSVAEARQAAEAGADVIVAQGAEAGGHRGAFDASNKAAQSIGLFALLPAICDAVDLPVVATGGIADARGIVAALALGASAVQIGTGLLRTPEAGTTPAWADALARAQPDDTAATRAFSGRLGRALRTEYVAATEAEDAPEPLPYPLQRAATAPMRAAGGQANDLARLQAWAGQSARLARAAPAEMIVEELWTEARAQLAG